MLAFINLFSSTLFTIRDNCFASLRLIIRLMICCLIVVSNISIAFPIRQTQASVIVMLRVDIRPKSTPLTNHFPAFCAGKVLVNTDQGLFKLVDPVTKRDVQCDGIPKTELANLSLDTSKFVTTVDFPKGAFTAGGYIWVIAEKANIPEFNFKKGTSSVEEIVQAVCYKNMITAKTHGGLMVLVYISDEYVTMPKSCAEPDGTVMPSQYNYTGQSVMELLGWTVAKSFHPQMIWWPKQALNSLSGREAILE